MNLNVFIVSGTLAGSVMKMLVYGAVAYRELLPPKPDEPRNYHTPEEVRVEPVRYPAWPVTSGTTTTTTPAPEQSGVVWKYGPDGWYPSI